MKPLGIWLTTVAYMQQLAIWPLPAIYTAPIVKTYLSIIKLLVITTTKTGHTPIFALWPLTAAILLASEQLVSLIVFSKPSNQAFVDSSLIYSMQLSSTKAKLAVYMQILSIKPIYAGSIYADDTQFSSVGPTYTVQISPSAIKPLVAMTHTSINHVFLVGLLPAMTNPSTSHGNELPIFLIDLSQLIITTYTGYSKELSNLAKIYINKAKHSNWNDSPKFNIANL